jgi:hypothetical protein
MTLYLAGSLLFVLAVRHVWRWRRARVDVSPLSERWLAEKRGARERD